MPKANAVLFLLGAIAAPLSYFAGAQLAGVRLPYGTVPPLLGLALLWALVLPLLQCWAWHPWQRIKRTI